MRTEIPVQIPFTNYGDSVKRALDAIGTADILPRNRRIILKPNLTNDSPPPVTTPVDLVEAVYLYCKARTSAPICIGEGCGSGKTADTFAGNGYTRLARRYGIELIDFNSAPTTRMARPEALQLHEFFMHYLPSGTQRSLVHHNHHRHEKYVRSRPRANLWRFLEQIQTTFTIHPPLRCRHLRIQKTGTVCGGCRHRPHRHAPCRHAKTVEHHHCRD
jgi:hypothetical protein